MENNMQQDTMNAHGVKQADDIIFSLDIGTRSVIGIVAKRTNDDEVEIIETARQEHKKRSMLDGQIHDVPQVAKIIASVKENLAEKVGPLQKVGVAAAGRALYTMTADAKMQISGVITAEQQKQLDFMAVQEAQKKLAGSNIVKDTSLYYCVGYSPVYYMLDGVKLKNLIGQQGHNACANVIATFLPRQVVDSIKSALHLAGLKMHALTLEPIAAISVLIPTTMRHLNIALVDIGAGTSDVAITKDGAVIAYGMVPMAGDEITEAISKNYLLDFNIAEEIKRKLQSDEKIQFHDILGVEYSLDKDEIIKTITESITDLAQAIAAQILTLNTTSPQAVMLVGGGSLTPHLAEEVAQKLSIPTARVAVRMPNEVDNVTNIPDELKVPDAVTPLGILKTSIDQELNLISLYINDVEYNMFNFKKLTVADVLLNAGINLHKYNGRPGMGIMINVNGKQKIISGTMGTLAKLKLDGKEASLSDIVTEKVHITIEHGMDGNIANACLDDVITTSAAVDFFINNEKNTIRPICLLNGEPVSDLKTVLHDKDEVDFSAKLTVANALTTAGYIIDSIPLHYTVNGLQKSYEITPLIKVNGQEVYLSSEVHENDQITFTKPTGAFLRDIIAQPENLTSDVIVTFNNKPCTMHRTHAVIYMVNGSAVDSDYVVKDSDEIVYNSNEQVQPIISDVLLAADFKAPDPNSNMTFQILKNGSPAEFTSPVKEKDNIKIVFKSFDKDEQIVSENSNANIDI